MSIVLYKRARLIFNPTLWIRENKSVEFQGSIVHKAYFNPSTAKQFVKHLQKIYDLLKTKSVPHVDKLYSSDTKLDPPRHWPYVRTGPVGICHMPKNLKELYDALKCVFEALQVRRYQSL